MLDHPVIDIGLGMIFFYIILSLVVSAIREWIASLLGSRSKNLRSGIQNLIGNRYADKVYQHPLVQGLSQKNKLPSYITSETFSRVLLEVVARDGGGESLTNRTADDLRERVKNVGDKRLRQILSSLIDDGEDAANLLKTRVADWFDEGMSRIAGWYKRQTKCWLLIIAVIVTVATNASSIHMVEGLWQNDALRTQIAAQAQYAAQTNDVSNLEKDNLDNLEKFPIGWHGRPCGFVGWGKTVVGWIITVAAVSLGAPFWFSLLGKVANLSGSGGQAQTRRTS